MSKKSLSSAAILFPLWTILLGFALEHTQAFGQAFGHRMHSRRQVVRTTYVPAGQARATVHFEPLDFETLKVELTAACAVTKEEFRQPTDSDIRLAQRRLLTATRHLDQVMRRNTNREDARIWRQRTNLDALLATLQGREGPDEEVLGTAFRCFSEPWEGFQQPVFEGVHKELRRLMRLYQVRNETAANYFLRLCDELPQYLEDYRNGEMPFEAERIAAALVWFDDLAAGPVPKAKQVVDLLCDRGMVRKNLYLDVGSAFITFPFARTIDEDFDINDTISGTRMTGRGSVSGSVAAELVPNERSAQIRLYVDSQMQSDTIGRNGPVTIGTATEGTISASKSLLIDKTVIRTTPTTAKAALRNRTTSLRINGGNIVRCIAQKQIEQRRPQAQAEARRRAERRLADRIDDELAPRLEEMNERFQTRLREPLQNVGLLPKCWDFSTTVESLATSLVLIAPFHQTTASEPAFNDPGCDLWLRVHQSAAGNFGQAALAGRSFRQKDVVDNLTEWFGETPEALKRDETKGPWEALLSARAPLTVVFKDDKIRITLTVNKFFEYAEDGTTVANSYERAEELDVTVVYAVKRSDGKITLEMEGEPTSFPRGQDRAAAAIKAATVVIDRRLKEIPAKIEFDPIELKGEWQGHTLTVNHMEIDENGWLSVGWRFD